MRALTCFKAYDVRGRLGVDLDEEIAHRIGRAFAGVLAAETVVLARDVRPSSEALADAVAAGLVAAGCRVLDLGLAGTEEMYCATSTFGADGGICVTASHNPIDYNGLKMVRSGSAPLDEANGLPAIKALAEAGVFASPERPGEVVAVAAKARAAYVARILDFVEIDALRPLKILVNAGNGAAGPCFDAIAKALDLRGSPLRFERLFHDPDGSFPHGLPNPLLPENRDATARAVIATGADFGVAWDGDFDRCFFFDHQGRFIEGEYIVGLLARSFLEREPGAAIIHDPRVIWNTCDLVARAGGRAVQSRTGHGFIKQAMRDVDAIYGGEMSAHHYFRDFFHCDSGMIPWLLVAELVSRHGPLADLVAARRAAFPSSGEMNFSIPGPEEALALVRDALGAAAISVDETDGLSLDMGDWRFNLRASNTEDLLRLNVEARGDRSLVEAGAARVKAILRGAGYSVT